MACAVLRGGAAVSAEQLQAWTNERLGKPQRLSAVRVCESLPRSDIGKVLKRQLRDSYGAVASH